MSATIEVHGLEREFNRGDSDSFMAVNKVDLEVREGEVYGFLGPNGAGKTTLVRMLVTLLSPTGGTALVAGHDIVREPAKVRSAIGVTLQEAALDPLMSGYELLLLQATLHGLRHKAAAAQADSLLERVDLVFAKDVRVGTYSGGMRRRLDLAMSLIHRPEVLFLDEPTTGLDPISRKVLWDEVRELNRNGTTVFLTTQYLEEADELADRVGIIDKGILVAEGTPAELKNEIGNLRLEVTVHDSAQAETARAVLARHGDFLPPHRGVTFAVKLPAGQTQIAPYVVELDNAGVTIDTINLIEPSLDDVFLMKTGNFFDADASETEPTPGDVVKTA
ncbi:MAG: ATP-binding cassette domain-containing protein [Thermoleophilaceae bacterium]|nr:ATP-binding cassette domain-containing protein [Thermoleophilaceae bacterium]